MSSLRSLLTGGHVIAYYPELARALGSPSSALFLQQIAYHEGEGRLLDSRGFVRITQEQLEYELVFSPRMQGKIRQKLCEANLLEEAMPTEPRGAKGYRIEWDNVEALLQSTPNGSMNHGFRSNQSDTHNGRPPIEEAKKSYVPLNRGTSGEREVKGEGSETETHQEHEPDPITARTITTDIYDHFKSVRYTMTQQEFGFVLGRCEKMLRDMDPTVEETVRLPEAVQKFFEFTNRLDPMLALRDMRRGVRREERIGSRVKGGTVSNLDEKRKCSHDEGYEWLFESSPEVERRAEARWKAMREERAGEG